MAETVHESRAPEPRPIPPELPRHTEPASEPADENHAADSQARARERVDAALRSEFAEAAPLAGVGGRWDTIDERLGGAVGQLDRTSCASACGEMVSGRQQRELVDAIGSPASATSLSEELGDGWSARLTPNDDPRWIAGLSATGPWIADLKDGPGGDLSHMVVVDGVDDDNRVMIRDPWNGGSTYKMTTDEFNRVWTGIAVVPIPRD